MAQEERELYHVDVAPAGAAVRDPEEDLVGLDLGEAEGCLDDVSGLAFCRLVTMYYYMYIELDGWDVKDLESRLLRLHTLLQSLCSVD
jgi:hypothetical protein